MFEREIRTRARFFGKKAEEALGEIFRDLGRYQTRSAPLVREAGPGTVTREIFRARRADERKAISRILQDPTRELGAPPSRLAVRGRMNPQWISMFYGALDPDTCVAEIAPPVGSTAVIGAFAIVRKLRLLDLQALQELFVAEASLFDPEFHRLRDKSLFLKRLVDIMSQPVLPNDEDYNYLPTQAVAEYLSQEIQLNLDGLIYPSSQRGGRGENVVLFRHSSRVETDGNEGLDRDVEFHRFDGEDLDITVSTRKKRPVRERARKRLPWPQASMSGSSGKYDSWPDIAERQTEEPVLRLNLDAIEVRIIEAVKYDARTTHVHWFSMELAEKLGDG